MVRLYLRLWGTQSVKVKLAGKEKERKKKTKRILIRAIKTREYD